MVFRLLILRICGWNIITSSWFHGVFAACDGVFKLRSYPIFENFLGD